MSFDKNKYDQDYAKNHFDRISLNVPKGDRERITNYAKSKGYKDATKYIKDLIYKDMERGTVTIAAQNIVNQNGDNNTVNIN